MKFQTRLMVVVFVPWTISTNLAWVLATTLPVPLGAVATYLPVTKGVPPLSRYLLLLPVVLTLLWPAGSISTASTR